MNLNYSFNKKTNEVDHHTLWDLLIIGAGPAGINAALYAKRKGLRVAILAYDLGGQLHNTNEIDNYLGFDQITGSELSKKFLNHVKILEVDMKDNVFVKKISKKDLLFHVETETTLYQSKTVLVTSGGLPRKLEIEGEEQYANKGVSYCAICDGPFFKQKEVIVAGGGNAAVEAAIDLAKIASKVTIIHRSKFRADQMLLERLKTYHNVEIKLESQLTRIYGNEKMQGVYYIDKKINQEHQYEASAIFIEIGRVPNSMFLKNIVQTNERNEVIVNSMQETSLEGLYAAGDITNQPYKQIIIAAAQGATAALAINQYLNTKGE